MRIVFVLPEADLSGGVRTVATYARLLARRGHEVTIVSTPAPGPSWRARVKAVVRGREWPRTPLPGPSHVDGSGVEHRLLARRRPVTDQDVPDADAVVATWWRTAEWVAALSPRKGRKFHFVQGDDAEVHGQPRERVLATWRLPLRRIVCSRWLLDLARSRHHDTAAVLVPNGVDLEQFTAPPRDKQAQPTVGLVYSDAAIKGCDVAATALAAVGRRLPGLRVISFGSSSPDPAVPLPPRVEFTRAPRQEEIPRLYASCDVWLWPSRREGFGLPILEAMACRTPVVAAPAGAAPEILAQGGGVLLAAAEHHPMADALVGILSLPSPEWRALSEQARAAAERHGWDASVRGFESVLRQAVEAG